MLSSAHRSCSQLGRKNVLPVDFDLPANGQIYCVSCAKYFKNDEAIARHNKSKAGQFVWSADGRCCLLASHMQLHKRLLKVLQEEPHRGEALPIDNGPLYGAAAME